MRRATLVIVLAAAFLGVAATVAAAAALTIGGTPVVHTSTRARSTSSTTTAAANPEAPIPEPASTVPPVGRRLSADRVLAIADRLPKLRKVRAEYRGSYGGAYLKGPFHWQVSYFSRGGKKEIGQAIIDDLTGRVLEQWTGFQVAWTMARGYPGAFGRHVNSLYVWLPMCLLFFAPFFDFRRPLSLMHLDLLMLLSFSVSLAFFNHAHIYASVPLSYPPLLYLLARMLALLRRCPSAPPAWRLRIPTLWLAIGLVFLVGFRIGLNVTDSNVIDVGYAGVIGAERITHGEAIYGSFPVDNEHGDTYGPFNYEAYAPFEQIFGWSGTWDDLPAAHAAAIVFDLLAVALMFTLGVRIRDRRLGVALAYAWAAYPFTLYALESNTNDMLVAVLVLAALLAASWRTVRATAARGAFSALAGITKIAPLALAPILATHGLRELPAARRPLAFGLFGVAFAATVAVAFVPALEHSSLHTIYERTIVYQENRGSPFSVWGLYGLQGAEQFAELAAVALALALAVAPRRGDAVGLAAACAAVIIALQLGIEHWFYLYIPWFFPLVMVALLGRLRDPATRSWDAPSAPARSSLPAVAAST